MGHHLRSLTFLDEEDLVHYASLFNTILRDLWPSKRKRAVRLSPMQRDSVLNGTYFQNNELALKGALYGADDRWEAFVGAQIRSSPALRRGQLPSALRVPEPHLAANLAKLIGDYNAQTGERVSLEEVVGNARKAQGFIRTLNAFWHLSLEYDHYFLSLGGLHGLRRGA